jgi:hypothetical protein
LDTL